MVIHRQEKHSESAYYLDWNEDGKCRRVSVSNDTAAEYNYRSRKQLELDTIGRSAKEDRWKKIILAIGLGTPVSLGS